VTRVALLRCHISDVGVSFSSRQNLKREGHLTDLEGRDSPVQNVYELGGDRQRGRL